MSDNLTTTFKIKKQYYTCCLLSLLFICLLFTWMFDFYNLYLFEIRNGYDEIISDLVSFYGNFLAVILLGSFLFDSRNKAVSSLISKVPEMNTLNDEINKAFDEQHKSVNEMNKFVIQSLQEQIDNTDRFNELCNESNNKMNRTNELINKKSQLYNAYSLPAINLDTMTNTFQRIILSIVIIILALIFIKTYSIHLFDRYYVSLILNGFIAFTFMAPVYIVLYIFRIVSDGKRESSDIKK